METLNLSLWQVAALLLFAAGIAYLYFRIFSRKGCEIPDDCHECEHASNCNDFVIG